MNLSYTHITVALLGALFLGATQDSQCAANELRHRKNERLALLTPPAQEMQDVDQDMPSLGNRCLQKACLAAFLCRNAGQIGCALCIERSCQALMALEKIQPTKLCCNAAGECGACMFMCTSQAIDKCYESLLD